ncbi:MAG: hypothetical protein GAK28_00298 [Luteibacter sp.]|nr:MAG: hypothetical protein GAK28_00298 [Luteibacter sp.]
MRAMGARGNLASRASALLQVAYLANYLTVVPAHAGTQRLGSPATRRRCIGFCVGSVVAIIHRIALGSSVRWNDVRAQSDGDDDLARCAGSRASAFLQKKRDAITGCIAVGTGLRRCDDALRRSGVGRNPPPRFSSNTTTLHRLLRRERTRDNPSHRAWFQRALERREGSCRLRCCFAPCPPGAQRNVRAQGGKRRSTHESRSDYPHKKEAVDYSTASFVFTTSPTYQPIPNSRCSGCPSISEEL